MILNQTKIKNITNKKKTITAKKNFKPNIKTNKKTYITINKYILIIRTYKINNRIIHKTYQLNLPDQNFYKKKTN